MARFKPYSYDQTKLIPVSYDRQILPGTFEYTLNEVIDSLDLSLFTDRYHNDETGAPAYDPRILLKIVLFAYSKGVLYSRKIAQLCTENIVFMALSADTHPHFTTIADFVSSMNDEIVSIFRHVVQICLALDLIDGSMFAIDGVKLPSNASKEWSGTKADLLKKKKKLEEALSFIIQQHRKRDDAGTDITEDADNFKKRLIRARNKIEKLDDWLANNDDKISSRCYKRQSNVTDNESAKMKSSQGVIQGYNGIAVVDSKHQIIVNAEAFGQGHDTDLLQPAVEGAQKNFAAIGIDDTCLENVIVSADTGFHSTDTLRYLENEKIDGYVPDCNFRKRDPRFTTAARYKPTNTGKQWGKSMFENADFTYVQDGNYYRCPAGNRLAYANSDLTTNKVTYYKYSAKHCDCGDCKLRPKCISHENPKRPRSLFRRSDGGNVYTSRMKDKIDTTPGRLIYSKRMAIVEPVFGNIRSAKGMRRFSLRGRLKVNIQWNLYCIVHNIEKICNFGLPAFA